MTPNIREFRMSKLEVMSTIFNNSGRGIQPSATSIGIFTGDDSDNMEIFVMDGNLTINDSSLLTKWKATFHFDNGPSNIYTVPLTDGKFEPLYVPPAALKTEEMQIYTASDCAVAMLTHCVSNKWLPKCVFSESEAILLNVEINNQRAVEIVQSLEPDKYTAFLCLCIRFTKLVENGYLSTTIVSGSIEKDTTIFEAAVQKGHNQSMIPMQYLKDHLRPKGNVAFLSGSGRPAYNATFSICVDKLEMTSWWQRESAHMRKWTNWFCPYSWYIFLPGVDSASMSHIKDMCETRNGRFVSIEMANSILDRKSLNILRYILSSKNGSI